MKKAVKQLISLCILAAAFMFICSCIPELQDEYGSVVLRISIAGFTEEGEKAVAFDLHSPTGEGPLSRSISLDSDFSATGYFTDLTPGNWSASVQFLHSERVIGTHDFSFDVYLDETTTNQIEGVYENGELTFTVWTTNVDTEPAVRVEESRITLYEMRDYNGNTGNDPDQLVRISATGDLSALKGLTVIFPDRYRFFFGPDAREVMSVRFEQFDESFGQVGFYLDRNNYFDSGTYFVSVYDINNLGDSFTETITLEEDTVSSPALTSPINGNTYSASSANDIIWNYADSEGIESTLIFVVRQDISSNLVFSKVIHGDFGSTVTMPAGTITNTIYYDIILIGTDKHIESTNGDPNNELLNFTDSGTYRLNDVTGQMLNDMSEDFYFIGSSALWIDAGP